MTTSIDPSRLRPRTSVDPTDGETPQGSAPNVDDRAVRRAADERLSALVSGNADSGPCDATLNPALFRTQSTDRDAVGLHDVRQGRFGDCFVLAPLGALTRTPEGRALIRNAVIENRNERGELVSYTVTLHLPRGSAPPGMATLPEVKVTIAPSFECGHARPRVESNAAEIWSLVVEAAYAKLAGGYPAIEYGGYPSVAMEVITGKPARSEPVSQFTGAHGAARLRAELASGNIVVFDTLELDPVACVAPPAQQNKMVLPGAYGLYPSHAYVAMGTEMRDGKEYLLLHNPWDKNGPDAIPFDELPSLFQAVDVGSVK
jgi:hypothetical protein